MAAATLARPPQIPTVPSDMPSIRTTIIRFAQAINAILRGQIGCTLMVTLAPSATTSTFSDSRIGGYTWIGLTPITASARTAALAGIYVVAGQGSATINHASNAATDQTFAVALLG
jgi:hypothetical protein